MSDRSPTGIWQRLKDNIAFRVGTIYAGGSWFIVEAADTLGASPAAVRRVALGLTVGFVIVVPLAWFLERRAARRVTADLVDGHWGIGTSRRHPAQARRGTRRWLAAVAVLVLLAGGLWFGGTRVYGGSVPEAATKIAVLPFQGTGSAEAREFGIGIVDLLSAALDHVGDIRTVSARTVLARTGTEPGTSPSLADALDIGRDVSAGSILTGGITSVGATVRLTAEIRTIEDNAILASASAEGPQDSILALTDELAVSLVRDMWRSREPLPTVATAGLLTSSPVALREYMRGERLLRSSEFDSATAAFRAATTADTAFALAWMRLAESAGWGQEVETSFQRRTYADNAERHAARLPVRERSLVRAVRLKMQGSFDAADSIAAYVGRYPDDAYAWYLLGDTRYHEIHLGLYSDREIIDPFLEAARLDPSFALGLRHIIDFAIETGDRDRYDASIQAYARVVPETEIQGLHAAARLRWAPSDSVLSVFVAEIQALRSVEDRQRINQLVNALGDRVRIDLTVDPDVYVEAVDSSRALFAGDRSWQLRARQLTVDALFAFGRGDRAFDALNVLADLAPLPFAPPPLQRPLMRLMSAVRNDLPPEMVTADAERIEAGLQGNPFFAELLRIYWSQAGDLDRAERYPIQIQSPPDQPPLDTAGVRLSLQGWEAALRGDEENAVRLIDDGFQRLGTRDVWAVDPVVFTYAELLSRLPDRRQQGIRMLAWFAHNRLNDMGRAWLALGRALEADGDPAGARDAYNHVVRLWANADDYLQDEVQEARSALERLATVTG